MSKKKQSIIIFFLFLFSAYCSITIGQSWDEGFHFLQGKITFDYLLSLGKINYDISYREYYSPIYWTLQYFFTKIFPIEYQIESSHFINLIFSLGTIFGTAKIASVLFDKKVSKIVFLILFFYPSFFGHMGFNPKDTILAFCHVWIFYLVFRYIKNQKNKYSISIGILTATGTGIQLFFVGSLIPIFIYLLCEIFIFKKFIKINFSKKKLFLDLIKCFFVFYILLIIFWLDTHSNVFTSPINILMKIWSSDYSTGYPYNLINGIYYFSIDIPKSYLFTNLIFRSPEYFLLSYLIFILFFIKNRNFFNNKFKFFDYKILFLFLFLLFPSLILLIVPYPIYDGVRLFLWIIPYYCIIPGIIISYLLDNRKILKIKFTLVFLSLFFLYFLINFVMISPYQYTYLNILNGKIEKRYQKFENDYWGGSLKELINKTNFSKNESIKMATCGVSPEITKYYFKNKGNYNINLMPAEDADYIIMTNRGTNGNKIINCFDKFKGTNISEVKRNKLTLSVIRKIN